MNEITRIHLARVAYDIELDAKKEFDTYLRDIKKILNDDDTHTEVELRMSEILQERGVKAGTVITAADIKAIRMQLGEPHDFGSAQDEDISADQPVQRRLLRDMEHKQIAGVAAGVAAYFGTEVVVVRLVFILLVLVNGLGLLLYLVLWAIMPPARTLSDRLSLRGQNATIESYKDYDPKGAQSEVPSWLLIAGRWVLGLGLILAGWLPIVAGTAGTIVTFTHQSQMPFPVNVYDWVAIGAAWVGAIAFSIFMTTLGLAVLRWSFMRIKWPLVISGVIGIISLFTIIVVGPIAAEGYRDRVHSYRCGTFREYPAGSYCDNTRWEIQTQ